jgi:SAM-dependent methyltransferase
MPPHASSLELFGVLREPVRPGGLLDIGCGSGCQSILLAAGYERVRGFDPGPAAVGFARANALINGVDAVYTRDRWETFRSEERFDHIVFNAPGWSAAFDFVNSGLDALLEEDGCAQIWVTCQVLASEGSLEGAVRDRVHDLDTWQVETVRHANSPFSLSPENVRARRLPFGTLVVDDPSQAEAFFQDLEAREVVEIVSATLTVSRRT